jgi:chaperonin GroEL
MCLWRIAQEIKPKTIGEEILKKALQAPLRKILENAGLDYTDIVLNMPSEEACKQHWQNKRHYGEKYRECDKMGYNVKDNVYQDFFESGVIDPSKVERVSVENAVSAASTFITSFATITDLPNDKK